MKSSGEHKETTHTTQLRKRTTHTTREHVNTKKERERERGPYICTCTVYMLLNRVERFAKSLYMAVRVRCFSSSACGYFSGSVLVAVAVDLVMPVVEYLSGFAAAAAGLLVCC